jgi:hypothetical protein
MVSEELLNQLRLGGIKVRVVRDADPVNDVKGYVMAWNDHQVMIKKLNKKVLKLDRSYRYQPWEVPRDNEENSPEV